MRADARRFGEERLGGRELGVHPRQLLAGARFAHREARRALGISGLLVLAGTGSAALGIAAGQVLLIAFAPIGLLVGGLQLFYWLKPPRNRMHWWLEYMSSMLTACTTTITALAVVNAPRLGLSQVSLWVWIGLPAVLAVGALDVDPELPEEVRQAHGGSAAGGQGRVDLTADRWL